MEIFLYMGLFFYICREWSGISFWNPGFFILILLIKLTN